MNGKNLCYNCFQEKHQLDGPCPYCGFDLAENQEKFPMALKAGTVLTTAATPWAGFWDKGDSVSPMWPGMRS